jgi:predicted transcriptional regulator
MKVRDIRLLPFLWISRELISAYRPSWRAILAYVALAYYARQGSGSCQIGIPALAKTVGVSQDTVRAGLRELQEIGAIRITPRRKSAGNGKKAQSLPSEYVLTHLDGKKTPTK